MVLYMQMHEQRMKCHKSRECVKLALPLNNGGMLFPVLVFHGVVLIKWRISYCVCYKRSVLLLIWVWYFAILKCYPLLWWHCTVVSLKFTCLIDECSNQCSMYFHTPECINNLSCPLTVVTVLLYWPLRWTCYRSPMWLVWLGRLDWMQHWVQHRPETA